MANDDSTQDRILRDYYRTTSGASLEEGCAGDRTQSLAGLRRRLGAWLNVGGKDVLELGCGTGELCQLALESGAKSVIGVNLSQEEIAYAQRYCSATFVCLDVRAYLASREDASCDVILAFNLLEHLDKSALTTVLEESHRILRSGGLLVAMVPNATSPFGSMTRYWDITHQIAFTPSSIRQLVRLVGFRSVEFRECGPMPHGFISAARFLAWRAIRFVIWMYLMVELASSKGGIYTADMLFKIEK